MNHWTAENGDEVSQGNTSQRRRDPRDVHEKIVPDKMDKNNLLDRKRCCMSSTEQPRNSYAVIRFASVGNLLEQIISRSLVRRFIKPLIPSQTQMVIAHMRNAGNSGSVHMRIGIWGMPLTAAG
eukprot:5931854-Amphidinium_carterae.1